MWWYRALHARLLDALAERRDASPVLDAGCGTGGFLAVLNRANPALASIGLEWHARGADMAAKKSGRPIARGSVNELPFAADTFGTVIAGRRAVSRGGRAGAALWPKSNACCVPAGGSSSTCRRIARLMSAHDVQVHNARRMNAIRDTRHAERGRISCATGELLERVAVAADDRPAENPRPIIGSLRCRRFSAMAGSACCMA